MSSPCKSSRQNKRQARLVLHNSVHYVGHVASCVPQYLNMLNLRGKLNWLTINGHRVDKLGKVNMNVIVCVSKYSLTIWVDIFQKRPFSDPSPNKFK